MSFENRSTPQIRAKIKKNVKKFWKRFAAVASVLVVGAASYPFLAPYIRTAAVGVVERTVSNSDEYAQRVSEIWSNKPKFETEKSDIYEPTYTDRILYTMAYPERELDGAYREKWIVDLNKFVMEELRLHEDAMIPFISKEANLVRSLAKKAEKINPEFADEGIGRLREDEAEFVTDVKKILKSEANFKRIMEYKQKHYNEYFSSRATASDPTTPND